MFNKIRFLKKKAMLKRNAKLWKQTAAQHVRAGWISKESANDVVRFEIYRLTRVYFGDDYPRDFVERLF